MAYNPHDRYYKKAKEEGYRSRAAYKLLELQQKFHLLQPGDHVIDLGAAPGGWLQVAAKIVGVKGKVIGIDLQGIEPLPQANVVIVQGDITTAEVQVEITRLLNGSAHCVISDLAPHLSGIRDADAARCLALNQTALDVATKLLRPNGALLIKSFINNELQTFTQVLKHHFRTVQRTRPEATRTASSECYFFAKGFMPNSTKSEVTSTPTRS